MRSGKCSLRKPGLLHGLIAEFITLGAMAGLAAKAFAWMFAALVFRCHNE
jgi:hypothetical protein